MSSYCPTNSKKSPALPMASTLCKNLIFVLLLLFPLCALSQNSGNITVGASLTADESSNPWLSPSGDFAFGFQQLPDNKDLFLLSIWFDKIPEKTIIWYKNGRNPVPRGSTIRLVAAGGLELRDPQNQFIWSTDLSPDETAYGFLNDTGNLVLFRSDSTRLWESFDNPTDTIVPTQVIEVNGMLISRKSETNFSQGRFYARMLADGNFVFSTKSVISNTDFDDDYYTSSTSDLNASNSGYQVVFDGRGSLFVRKRNGEQSGLSSQSIPPASENYYRATLNFDGVFIQYYHPKNGNPGWTVVGYWPNNICMSVDGQKGSGACGYNNVCQLQNGRPNCVCPTGFTLVDQNDRNGDCKSNAVSNCIEGEKGSPEDIFELVDIQDTDWPFNDFSQIAPSTEEDCRSSCLNDCFCGVAIYRSNSCWKKRLPLSNGRIDTTLNAKAFFKFRKGDVPFLNPNSSTPNTVKKDQRTLILIGSVLLGSSAFINFLFITAACLFFFLSYKKKIWNFSTTLNSMGSNLRCFTYTELQQATSGFKEELGSGAFGTVYKGVLQNSSKTIVAVKKLERVAKDSEKEFRAEVNVIGHTHHKNLVHLLGFCDEGPNRLLVYEYMSNGTLANFLFGKRKPSWIHRTQMAIGVAQGLTYLHEECGKQIIHCDIKPQNILLDDYYNARIADFGLCKLLLMDQSRTLTNIRGTKGYVAPEWFRNTQITLKVDVYSFGVLLLEIVSCRKSLESGNEVLSVLTDLAWDCYTDRRLDILVENDSEASDDLKRVERFVKVGLWCIQEDLTLRPSMKKVCQMLEGVVEVEDPPCPSPFT